MSSANWATGAGGDALRVAMLTEGTDDASLIADAPSANEGASLTEPSLISYYTFENDTTGAIADVAPDNPHDSASISGTIDFTGGIAGGSALSLTGSNFVDFGSVADFDFTDGTGTIEAWILPEFPNSGPNRSYLGNRTEPNSRYSLYMSPNRTTYFVWTNPVGTVARNATTVQTDWIHVVTTFDNGTTRIYVNGSLIGTSVQDLGTVPGLKFYLGTSDATRPDENWIGGIDEVAIYTTNIEHR